MQIKSVVRASALVSTVALLALTGSPALAAEPVAQAKAVGLTLSLAGQPASTGQYSVVNDGSKETKSGSNQPTLGLLGNQNLLSVGTLAQDATTAISNGNGSSAACAGLAGQGASLAAAGSGSCLTGGNALNLTAAQLDLQKIANTTLVQGQVFTGLNGLLTQLGLINQVTPLLNTLQTALNQVTAPLANSGLVLGAAGAIQSSCTADVTSAAGTANIANIAAYLQLPSGTPLPSRIDLVNFPANPAPNTEVVVGLDKVTQAIITATQTSLNTSAASGLNAVPGLAGILTGLGLGLQTVQDQIVANVVAQLQPLLQPLQANVLRATLNKQTKASANQITVTALDVSVLDAARQFTGNPLLAAQVGTSTCGPNGRVAATASPSPTPTPTKKPNPTNPPKVPTSVPAGLADAPSRNAPLGGWALAGIGALLVASFGAGTAAYRKSSAKL